METKVLFAVVAAVYLSGCAAKERNYVVQPTPEKVRPSKVLLVSIDGLRPEFYLTDDFKTPTLKGLMKSGSYAKSATAIFPSVTYPNHTTIATGVSSAKHGVLSNTIFTMKEGNTHLWYWEEKYVKAPTIWQRAKTAGKSVAILRWPASVGAKVDWLLPEIFSAVGVHKESDWERIVKHIDKNLLDEIVKDAKQKQIGNIEQVDPWTTYAAHYVLEKYKPDFAMLHMINVDFSQHMNGRDSSAVKKAVEKVDEQFGHILSAIDLKTTAVVVVGDHGFIDYNETLNLNVLFAKQGWLKVDGEKVKSWKVQIHSDGAQAAVYLRDKSLLPKVTKFLEKESAGKFRVLTRKELDEYKAYPEASLAVVADQKYVFGKAVTGEYITKTPSTRGHHGHLPSLPQMKTGFIASGAGIRQGKVFEEVRLVDIAPTVAKLLDIEMPTAEGIALELTH